MTIPFMSLELHEDASAVRSAIDRVIARGWFVLGPEVEAFETEFAAAFGARYAIGVGNGTDAIALILRALNIGVGDEVITSPLSAAFSALAILMAGARPVFADIDPERLTIDPDAIERVISPRTAAILPVHLYGQASDMTRIAALAHKRGLAVVEDACQAHLATTDGRPVGTVGVAGAFSFYPTKNLGALGDGGAVLTSDPELANRLRSLRNGGQSDRYTHPDFGVNSRLDEIQAAVLRARLEHLPRWTARRRDLAARYRAGLAGTAVHVPPQFDVGHVYHLFPVLAPDRAHFMAHLKAHGIGSLIHYPIPIPRQAALESSRPDMCPIADRVSAEVCSLPLHPHLSNDDADRVIDAVRAWQPSNARLSP